MSKKISLLKGKVVIEGELLEPEQELLVKKYKSKRYLNYGERNIRHWHF